jgi:hypothetical protein
MATTKKKYQGGGNTGPKKVKTKTVSNSGDYKIIEKSKQGKPTQTKVKRTIKGVLSGAPTVKYLGQLFDKKEEVNDLGRRLTKKYTGKEDTEKYPVGNFKEEMIKRKKGGAVKTKKKK